MSDIEREKFEQAVTDRWSDSYSFTRFENGEYMDDFLQQYWIGWQASREGVGGDSESIIGFHNALQRVKKIFSEYRQDWPKWGKRLDGTPALNDLPVRIAAAFSELYTQPVSFGADDYPDCDTCGASINYMPWHYSKGTDRHLHSCDMCWPEVNPVSATSLKGWKLVPINPTGEMLGKMKHQIDGYHNGTLVRRYHEMLDAAPNKAGARP